MIETVLFVPSAPMLLPEYVGAADPAAEMRELCVRTLRESLAGVDRVVIAADDRPPTVGGWTGEPLGLRVGRHLLELAGWTGPVTVGAVDDPGGGPTAYVVVGDGSAKRSERAPGHLDQRAFDVDATILRALGSADTAALSGLDPALCDELLVTAAAPLGRAAYVLRDRTDLAGEVLWSGDPYGVLYWVARWTTPSTA